jgi:predicted ATPase/class 3 adenylate cyclase
MSENSPLSGPSLRSGQAPSAGSGQAPSPNHDPNWGRENVLPTGTVTFLFTDIQGSTPLWESQPEKMAQALQVHNTALRGAIQANGGAVFKTVGDAFQAAFPRALPALQAAIAGQKALAAAPWNELGELKVRMGLHTGEAEVDPAGDEYAVSHTKNRVARIMSAASGGQVLLSQETKDLVDHQLPEGVTLKDLGEHRLKGMATLELLYQVCAPGLAQEFTPLATAITHPHNLPVQLTSFIGREQETAMVLALLEKNRLVTLTGSGGTGKTRLSLQVAEEALENYPHGVWFTELAGLGDPDLVPRSLAAVLGLVENPNRSPLDQIKDYLKEKQALIILDNCEHVIADCARVAEALLLACPKIKIMASSREALSVAGEVTYHVPSLPVPDPNALPPPDNLKEYAAVQLFVARASAAHPDFNLTPANALAVAQVCRRLDGIPLAIELAAARVGALSVEQIAARLDNRFRLLTGGSRTAVPRQQTLRASIDWSYSLLDECERLLLMRLSVFQGGWTLEQATEVCAFDGLDEYGVLDSLTQLVNKSLLYTVTEADGAYRYRRLETIRQYGREKLLDSGASETVHDRHLRAFLNLALAAEPHLRAHAQLEWLDRLENELDNLRLALEWSLENHADLGLRLATALYWFWHIRGYRLEGEQWLRNLLERIKLHPGADPALIAEAQGRQALLLCAIGRIGETTEAIANEALAAGKQLGEAGKRIQFVALHALAWNAGYLYQKNTLYELFKQCLEIAQSLEDRFLIAEAAQNLSYVEPDQKLGIQYSELNLRLRQELGDLDGMMTAEGLLGGLYYTNASLDQALLHLEESVRLAKRINNRVGALSAYGAMGRVWYAKGDFDGSIQQFNLALELIEEVGDQTWVGWLVNGMGYAYGAKKDWVQSQEHFQRGLLLARKTNNLYWEVIHLVNTAEVARSLGKERLARQYYLQAAQVAQAQAGLPLEGLVYYSLGMEALLGSDFSHAAKYLQQALQFYHQTLVYDLMGGCLQALAVCALKAGQMERAARLHGILRSRRWQVDPVMPLWLIPYDLDSLLTPARLAQGEAEYDRLFAEGKVLTLEQAVAFAMSDE